MPAWKVQRLAKTHDRGQFNCGNDALDTWFRERAGQFDRRNLSRTFVATLPNELAVLGFYALSSHRVVSESLPKSEAQKLPRLDVPVILLGRLAVDRETQGKGLGSFLLVDALRRSLIISEQVGVRAVEVNAIDEAARRFYLKFGFHEMLDDERHLFLPLHEIRKLDL